MNTHKVIALARKHVGNGALMDSSARLCLALAGECTNGLQSMVIQKTATVCCASTAIAHEVNMENVRTKSSFTPGPWSVVEPYTDAPNLPLIGHAVDAVQTTIIAQLQSTDDANARLIAAAPDLAEALRELVGCAQYLPFDPMLERAIAQGRAALAKAGL